jgi:hypothetical protein
MDEINFATRPWDASSFRGVATILIKEATSESCVERENPQLRAACTTATKFVFLFSPSARSFASKVRNGEFSFTSGFSPVSAPHK